MSEYQKLWNRVTESSEDEAIRTAVLKLTEDERYTLFAAVKSTNDVKRDAVCYDAFHRMLFTVGCYLSRVNIYGKIEITTGEVNSSFDDIHANEIARAELTTKLLLVEE